MLTDRKPGLVAVNGRYRVHTITGVQRYAHEIAERLKSSAEILTPRRGKGIQGHAWEQTLLPVLSAGRLLWSPSASGPLWYRRQVVTFHDIFPLEHPEWYSVQFSRWYSFMFRRLAATALHLIAVSQYTKSRMVDVLGVDPAKITVIHNGPTAGMRPASESEKAAAHAALQLPSQHYILSLSSLEKRKNLDTMLEAWRLLQHKLPSDTWLVLAGQRADTKVYGRQNLREVPPRVWFTGYVPESHLPGLYSGAALFVCPSLAEGFGLPLLEAMACGVRCVASNTTSLPEVGGEAATYIDPKAPGELANAITRSYKHGNRDGAFLPSIIQASRFSWDTAADKTQQLLCSAAESTANQLTAKSRFRPAEGEGNA